MLQEGFNRKTSLQSPSKSKAVALYRAPVVSEKYKHVIAHFKKPKNSCNGQRLDPIVGVKETIEILASSSDIVKGAVNVEQKNQLENNTETEESNRNDKTP